MAIFPPTLRITAENRRPSPAFLPWLALGLFFVAFLGVITEATRDTALKIGALAAESSSDVPHLSKREPVRFLTPDIRRDGTASTAWSGGKSFAPAMAAAAAIVFSSAVCFYGPGDAGPAGSLVLAYRSRAPPLAA
ncbi:MAG TPA: hypothetical protein VGO22_06685 [Pseudorhizobium sp.]|jgi:hypothetical protein|nr:hypothetical protein [Pseudorhizobium sp.]